jgi:hypothetical protein
MTSVQRMARIRSSDGSLGRRWERPSSWGPESALFGVSEVLNIPEFPHAQPTATDLQYTVAMVQHLSH